MAEVAEGVAEVSEEAVGEPVDLLEVEAGLAGEPAVLLGPVPAVLVELAPVPVVRVELAPVPVPVPVVLVELRPQPAVLVELVPVPAVLVELLPQPAVLVDLVRELAGLAESVALAGRASVSVVSLPVVSACVVGPGWVEAQHFARQPYWELRAGRCEMVSRASIPD